MSSDQTLACARVRVLLEAYVDGDLATGDPGLAKAVRAHLATCADCRHQHDQAASLPFRLKALSAPAPRETFTAEVMRSITPVAHGYRSAWALLVPEAVLVAFILWYMSGLDGLATVATGIFDDLQTLAGWGAGAGPLPDVPAVDVFLLLALIALAGIAAYHLSILIRITSAARPVVTSTGARARRA